jgi:predicted PurR-regulated permease PerM
VSRYISFITLLIVIVLVVLLFYRVIAGFMIPLVLAALLVVIFRPLHLWILERCKGRKKTAALLTTAAIMLAVLVPLGILFTLAAFEGQQLLHSGKPASARHPAHIDVITGPGDFYAQCKRLLGTFLANNTLKWGKISSGIERETLWIATPTELF